MKGLTEGRIVHYVLPDGTIRPAIVVKVWRVEGQTPENGCCNLQVFTDYTNDEYRFGVCLAEKAKSGQLWATSIVNNEAEKTPGTWHWIEPA